MANSTFAYNNKTYQTIKWCVQVVLPAVATLYFALGNVWAFPNVEQVVGSITAVATFLGVSLGISTHNYNKSISTMTPATFETIVDQVADKLRKQHVSESVIDDVKQDMSSAVGDTNGGITVQPKPDGGIMFDLVLNQDPSDLQNMSRVVFDIQQK